jgi:ribose transport system substrate-binding protein
MSKGKSICYSMAWLLLACFMVTGCGGSSAPEDTPQAAGQAPAKAMKVIGMSQCNLAEPWRVQMNGDIAAAAAMHPELEIQFKDAQNDTLVQRAHIEEFVNQGVDVLICSPKEAGPLTEPLKKAFDAGIPVIILDRAVQGDSYTQFIGADNKIIGEAAGRWVAEALKEGGKIVELKGLMTSTPGQDRNSGFRKGLEGSAVEVIFEADMQWLEPEARKEMESALARFGKIDLVYAHNDPAAHGAWLAAKAAGRENEMRFVGIDGLPHEGLQYVREGILDVCFEYPTGGGQAIDTALKLLAGESVPKTIVLPSRFFTPENIEGGGEWLPAPAGAQ